jgi:muramoyltetrapeptide carboxypeptidase
MKGKSIGIFSSGGVIGDRMAFERGIQILEDHGFLIKKAPHLYGSSGLFPSDGETLARDFMDLYLDSEVDILLASKGGYGTSRILPFLDYNAIKNEPKVVCGYSDLTALLSALVDRAEIPVYHGPMITSLGSGISKRSLDSLLDFFGGASEQGSGNFFKYYGDCEKEIEILSPGSARGILKGGNLTVFTTLLGTDFEVDCAGSILFIEDIHEEPYRIHRMMNHLKMNGSLDKAEGFLIGQFTNCGQPSGETRFQPDIKDIMREFLIPLKKPVLWNLPAGHTADSMTLVPGRTLLMECETSQLKISYL